MFDFSKMKFELPQFKPGSPMRYWIAVTIVALATAVRWEIPIANGSFPFLSFFPAVVLITLVCGGRVGIASVLVSLALAWAFFLPHTLSYENFYFSTMFVIGSGAVILVAGAVRYTTIVIRQLNETLRQSEAKFRGLLEAAPDAMVIVDATGRVLLVNAATEHLFGYPRSELIGQFAAKLMPAAISGESYGYRKDGSNFPIEVSYSPLQTEDGPMVSSAIRDVTARRQIEADLIQASRAKSDFLSGMSHELRTPLNAVVGFAELLKMKGADHLTEKQHEYVDHILEGGNHLLVLVTQLLDLAGIEAGRLNLSITPVSVEATLTYVHNLMVPLALKAGVKFELNIPRSLEDARADELRLRQVLINLLSNAIKYNHPGGQVTLRADTEGSSIRFVVSDTGVGIPAERKSELFQPFHRLGAEHSSVSGTGIGLALSRRIVEAMGGTLGFSSEAGVGSTFWVEMPAEHRIVRRPVGTSSIADSSIGLGEDGALSLA